MKTRDGRLHTLGLVLLAALAVALVRGRIFDQNRRIKETSDLYVLPPAREVAVMSLGYRAALADLLWAHLLVSQGLHTMEKRRFENIILLLDAINELDPTFRDPYRMADALITFNANVTPVEDARAARAIMERGLKNRPLDAELWLVSGEFVAFLAPNSYLKDPAEAEQWRVDGARMLARAAELSGNDSNIAWQALGGARYLGRAGARDAEIRFLQRTLVVTDDEELKEKVRARLEHLLGDQRAAEQAELFRRLERGVWDARHHDVPFVTRMRYMVLGPPRDPARCAGTAGARAADCAESWREWEDRSEAARALPR
ncbi:MAG: hypothetical protein QM820_35740 [Minicystis sp.]